MNLNWAPVYALSVTQVISWGTLYYAFSVLLIPMGTELGWRQSEMVGAFSLSLLLTGVSTFVCGLAVQRWGGRRLMAGGSVLAALAILSVSRSHTLPLFYLSWATAGIAMGATLYETAFSVLAGVYEAEYKKAVTTVTLAGGLASTVFWPATEWLVTQWGWQTALEIYAVLHLAVCLPLHWRFLPRQMYRPGPAAGMAAWGREIKELIRTPRFQLLAGSYVLSAIVFSAVSVHLVPLLLSRGMGTRDAAWLAAAAGPMQVAGRIVEFRWGARWQAAETGRVVLAILVPAMLLLAWGGQDVAVLATGVALYGASNGVMTIVRSVSITEAFGRERYPVISGALMGPAIIARAIGPLAASLVLAASGGYQEVMAMLSLVSAGALLLYIYGMRDHARSRRSVQ